MRELAVGLCLVSMVYGFLKPRHAVPVTLVWILVVGALRKWAFNELQAVLFIAAHPYLGAAYLGHFLRRKGALSKASLALAPPFLALLVVWSGMEMFNPRLPSPLVGVLGVAIRLWFIPFAYLVADWATSKETLLTGVRRYVLLAVPLLLLGFAQFASPHDAEINRYVWGGDPHKAAAGGAVRVTATFAYIWGYTAYLPLIFLLLLALLGQPREKGGRVRFLLHGVLLGLVAINLLMTGTRSAVLLAVAALPAFWVGMATIRGGDGARGSRARAAGIMVTLLAAGAAVALSGPGSRALGAFTDRMTTATDTVRGRLGETLSPLTHVWDAGLLGYGLGSTYQGSRQLVKDDARFAHLPQGLEEEPERLLVELGLVGYLLTYLVRFVIVRGAWRSFRHLRDPGLRALALSIGLYHLPVLLHLQVHADNLEATLFLWATTGVLLALPRLDSGGDEPVEVTPRGWPFRDLRTIV